MLMMLFLRIFLNMKNKTVHTWQAQIFCGLRKGYEVCSPCQSIEKIYSICRRYVHQNKWCVTVTPTKFIYTGGDEDGAIIGIIQYPRFPKSYILLKERVIELAEILRIELGQYRVSIVFPEETIMLEKEK